jgi:hypothetical protein
MDAFRGSAVRGATEATEANCRYAPVGGRGLIDLPRSLNPEGQGDGPGYRRGWFQPSLTGLLVLHSTTQHCVLG